MNKTWTLVKPYQIEMQNVHLYQHRCNLYDIQKGPAELKTEIERGNGQKCVERIRDYPQLLKKRQEEKGNKELLTKIIGIGTGKISCAWQKNYNNETYETYKRSMNKKKMLRERMKVSKENNVIAKRISTQSGTISRDKQLQSSQKLLDLMVNMEKVPRAQKMSMTQTVNPALKGLIYKQGRTISESMKELRARTAKYKEEFTKPPDEEKLDTLNRAQSSNKIFRIVNKENVFNEKVSTANKFFIDKNPNSYTIEFTVNSIQTCIEDCDKFRYMINHKSFSQPIVFNPKNLNQPCSRTFDTTQKANGEIIIDIEVFAVIDKKEKFAFHFQTNLKMSKAFRKIEKTTRTEEGDNSITLLQKLY